MHGPPEFDGLCDPLDLSRPGSGVTAREGPLIRGFWRGGRWTCCRCTSVGDRLDIMGDDIVDLGPGLTRPRRGTRWRPGLDRQRERPRERPPLAQRQPVQPGALDPRGRRPVEAQRDRQHAEHHAKRQAPLDQQRPTPRTASARAGATSNPANGVALDFIDDATAIRPSRRLISPGCSRPGSAQYAIPRPAILPKLLSNSPSLTRNAR